MGQKRFRPCTPAQPVQHSAWVAQKLPNDPISHKEPRDVRSCPGSFGKQIVPRIRGGFSLLRLRESTEDHRALRIGCSHTHCDQAARLPTSFWYFFFLGKKKYIVSLFKGKKFYKKYVSSQRKSKLFHKIFQTGKIHTPPSADKTKSKHDCFEKFLLPIYFVDILWYHLTKGPTEI